MVRAFLCFDLLVPAPSASISIHMVQQLKVTPSHNSFGLSLGMIPTKLILRSIYGVREKAPG